MAILSTYPISCCSWYSEAVSLKHAILCAFYICVCKIFLGEISSRIITMLVYMPCQIKSQTSVWDETVYLACLYVCQVCLLYNWQKNEYYKLRLLKLVFKNRSIHSFFESLLPVCSFCFTSLSSTTTITIVLNSQDLTCVELFIAWHFHNHVLKPLTVPGISDIWRRQCF